MANILLVDDDSSFRKMLRQTMTRLGHTITEAANGDEALQLHQQGGYHAVLIDLIMPDKEGIETIIAMRRQQADVKIVAMSGGGRLTAKDVLAVAKAMGADQILAKPFSDEALVSALAAVIPPT